MGGSVVPINVLTVGSYQSAGKLNFGGIASAFDAPALAPSLDGGCETSQPRSRMRNETACPSVVTDWLRALPVTCRKRPARPSRVAILTLPAQIEHDRVEALTMRRAGRIRSPLA